MEIEIRNLLSKNVMSEAVNVKDLAREYLIGNEDVQFHWSIMASNWDEIESNTLLSMIIDAWIMIRRHSTRNHLWNV